MNRNWSSTLRTPRRCFIRPLQLTKKRERRSSRECCNSRTIFKSDSVAAFRIDSSRFPSRAIKPLPSSSSPSQAPAARRWNCDGNRGFGNISSQTTEGATDAAITSGAFAARSGGKETVNRSADEAHPERMTCFLQQTRESSK